MNKASVQDKGQVWVSFSKNDTLQISSQVQQSLQSSAGLFWVLCSDQEGKQGQSCLEPGRDCDGSLSPGEEERGGQRLRGSILEFYAALREFGQVVEKPLSQRPLLGEFFISQE